MYGMNTPKSILGPSVPTCSVSGDGVDWERPHIPVRGVAVSPYVPLHHMTKAVAGIELVPTKVRVHRVARMLMTIQRVHTQSLSEEEGVVTFAKIETARKPCTKLLTRMLESRELHDIVYMLTVLASQRETVLSAEHVASMLE